jgi:hypothetical protein
MTLEVCCGPLSSVSAQTKASTRSGEYTRSWQNRQTWKFNAYLS